MSNGASFVSRESLLSDNGSLQTEIGHFLISLWSFLCRFKIDIVQGEIRRDYASCLNETWRSYKGPNRISGLGGSLCDGWTSA